MCERRGPLTPGASRGKNNYGGFRASSVRSRTGNGLTPDSLAQNVANSSAHATKPLILGVVQSSISALASKRTRSLSDGRVRAISCIRRIAIVSLSRSRSVRSLSVAPCRAALRRSHSSRNSEKIKLQNFEPHDFSLVVKISLFVFASEHAFSMSSGIFPFQSSFQPIEAKETSKAVLCAGGLSKQKKASKIELIVARSTFVSFK